MATIELGTQPHTLVVQLTAGADFISTIATSNGTDWPGTAALELRFSDGTAWSATINGPEATWNVDQVDVDAAIDAAPTDVRLVYTDGDVDAVWAQGRARW